MWIAGQGGEGSNKEGVIPIAVRQVLQNAKAVNRRGKVSRPNAF